MRILKRIGIWFGALIIILFAEKRIHIQAEDGNSILPSEQYRALAEHWAPTIYQDINTKYLERADIPTVFHYDNDWRGDNNWENLEYYPEIPAAYFSVRETLTHYFIEYDFYYPRDDGPISPERHENDIEGCILVIQKNGSMYGILQVMETQAHNHWYQYSNESSVFKGSDDIDGGILLDMHRPKLYISANGIGPDAGHGVKAYKGESANGGDGIVFRFQTGAAEMPTRFDGDYVHEYDYKLVSMDELWNRRKDQGGAGHTYYDWGHFHGDTYTDSSCTLPWIKDDPDDGPLYEGVYWADPAFFVDTHLNGLGSFSHTYIFNPYYTHRVTVFDVTSCANRDSFNDESDIFIKISVGGLTYINQNHWKVNQAGKYVKNKVRWGGDQAEFGNQYSESFQSIYFAREEDSEVRIQIMDKDGTSSNDDMGSLSVILSPGGSIRWSDEFTSLFQAKVSALVETNPAA